MEGLAHIVSESLARHGFDRPLDYRRLRWSRWFRCESHHSLLVVPSKPGVFAVAEEIIPADQQEAESRKPEGLASRRLLAVTQFFEDDDMAYVLDRMLSRNNPLRASLLSGRYFVRFVVIEDEVQRRSICNSLNQWIASSGETASGIGAHFAASLELSVARAPSSAIPVATTTREVSAEPRLKLVGPRASAPQLDSGAASNMHCPCPFPSGF